MEKKETFDGKVASVLNRLNLKHNKLAGKLRVRSKLQVIIVQVTSSARTRDRCMEDRPPPGSDTFKGTRKTPGPQKA